MTNYRKTFILLILVFFPAIILATINCHIDFQIKGLEKSYVVFACEYGDKQLVLDTIKLDNEGKGTYESKDRLKGGIYVIALPSGKYFELLINDEQFFSFMTDTSEIIENLIIEGSEESLLFHQYQVLVRRFENTRVKSKTKELAETHGLKDLKNRLDSFRNDVKTHLPKSFLAKYLIMQEDPKLPEMSNNQKLTKENFIKRHYYLKDHYFDNIDFSDERYLRTRLLYEKLNHFFNVIVSQNADSICKEIDRLQSRSKVSTESYRYTLNFLINNFKAPQKTYQENVLVYLADNYYLHGKAEWVDPRFLSLLKERTDNLRINLIGVKAPNLVLQSLERTQIDVYKIKAKFLLVFFFSSDCPICQDEAQKLNNKYEQLRKNGLEILAVYTHADKEQFQKFINEKGYKWTFAYDPLLKSNFSKLYNVTETPKYYLLDENKAILEKTSRVGQLTFSKVSNY